MSKKSDSFYNNLKTKLNETHDWPTINGQLEFQVRKIFK